MPVDLFELPTLDRRRNCECCGYPTLNIPEGVGGETEWASSTTACDLCEWESAALGDDGDPIPSPEEDRNDGLALDVARRHLERYGSIYDPDNLPLWKVSAPSAWMVEARYALRAAYGELRHAPVANRWKPWARVRMAEGELRAAMLAQQAQDEEFANGAP
jgi:hypothetical protein